MATSTVKSHSNPLHNFSLPSLKWSVKNQTNTPHRHRRPASGDTNLNNSDHESEFEPRRSKPARNRIGSSSNHSQDKSTKQRNQLEPSETTVSNNKINNNEPQEQEAAERKGKRGDDDNSNHDTKEGVQVEVEGEGMVEKPWKLRPRKPVFSKATVEIGVGPTRRNGEYSEESNLKTKSRRLRGTTEVDNMDKNGKKRKFWIALSKDEIAEDVFAMTGSRPARRPMKRDKNVQKNLDRVFPALWLVGLSADEYKA